MTKTMPVHTRSGVAASALLVLLATGCQEFDFEQSQEISKLRPIGVLLEPPEAGPDDVVTVSVVLASPDEERTAAATVRWELCAFTGSRDSFFECPTLPDGTSLGFPLGEGQSVTVDVPLLASLGLTPEALCENLIDLNLPEFIELPRCDRGYSATLRFVITDPEGGGEIIGIRSFPLLFAEEAAREDRNANPRFDRMLVNGVPRDPDVPFTVSLAEEGQTVRFTAIVDVEEHAQRYSFPDPQNPGQRRPEQREQLQIEWYSSLGNFPRDDSYFAEGIAPAAELQNNRLELNERRVARVGDRVRVWAVLRDDRGGIDWGSWVFDVVE